MTRFLTCAAVLAAVLVQATAGPASTAPGCTARQIHASFDYVPGSAAAGHVTYIVKLVNRGTPCTISGRPGLRLYDGRGRPLPTHAFPDHPGTGTAVLVTIRTGHSARANARFSPDVPGPGEGNPCERAAVHVHVTLPSPAQGAVIGPVKPRTPVCEHGRIVLGLLHGG